MIVCLDSETYSSIPITNGSYRYFEAGFPIIIPWAVDNGPVQVWQERSPASVKQNLRNALVAADKVVAHNANFDRQALAKADIAIPLEKWHCTQAQAYLHSLPGGLDALCQVMSLPLAKSKDKSGKDLIQIFCKPQSNGQRVMPEDNPDAWARFISYAMQDVEALRALYKKLPKWNLSEAERRIWMLDQTINDRGIPVDCNLAGSVVRMVTQEKRRLARDAYAMTAGEINSATRRDKLLGYLLKEYGVDLPDLSAGTLRKRLEDENLPEEVRELIRNREQAATSSTAKFQTLLRSVCQDGRLRGTTQYCGAGRTGRWGARLFQPQNLPRPTLPPPIIEDAVQAFFQEDPVMGGLPLLGTNIMEMASNAVRSVVVAPEGKKLVIADLSNIEGRVAAWTAGEEWKLEAYRAYDAGKGPDLYKLAYSRVFGVPVENVTKAQRQVGKVLELLLQYEGGVGAIVTGAETYGVDLAQMADACWKMLPEDLREEAQRYYEFCKDNKRPTYGLSEKVFVACDTVKRIYREQQTQIVARWSVLKEAFKNAAFNPKFAGGSVTRYKNWVLNKLPSGRYLSYPSVKVDEAGQLTYMGISSYTAQWGRFNTYGGKLFENETQAIARDVLAWSMERAEGFGYEIVMHVHDELVCEAPDEDYYCPEHLSSVMSTGEDWSEGLPLAAAGYETYRYYKEQ